MSPNAYPASTLPTDGSLQSQILAFYMCIRIIDCGHVTIRERGKIGLQNEMGRVIKDAYDMKTEKVY